MSDTNPSSGTSPAPDAQTVLLTGISGFIAKRIAADLLNAGHSVRGTLRSMDRADEVRDAVRPALTNASNLDARLTFAEADLMSDTGWAEAANGATALMHTASPFPIAQPKSADELVRPAVEGTLRALTAARDAGVTRVVLTSSMAAVMHNDRPRDHVYTEADWSEVDHPTTSFYSRSKTEAERAAWDFAEKHPEVRLTTILPGLVTGRPMDDRYGSSLAVIERFLSGKDPVVPNFGLPVVDLADVSAMHLAALHRPETAGRRYIAAERFVMAPEMARWLAEAYPERRIATRMAPKWLLRMLALVDGEVKMILPSLDDEKTVSADRARSEMGIDFVPARNTLLAAAAFLDGRGTKKAA